MLHKKAKGPGFEEALKKLEEIVEKLEQGDLPLEQTLRGFETGMKWVRICEQRLDQAEKKIQILIKDKLGKWDPVDFSPEDGDNDA